jgi:hypothetical protein
LPDDVSPLNKALAVVALRRMLEEVEAGQLDVVRVRYDDDDRVSLTVVCVAPSPEDAVRAAGIRDGRLCQKCSSAEVRDVGGMDRFCVRCQHVWTLEP